jgi:hypothetical protein
MMRAFAIAAAMTLGACLQHGTPAVATPGPEEDCADACRAHAPGCSDAACARGCRVAMDRLVEREQRAVIACVARASKTTCDDMTFAECAARSGPYVNGGPPPPKPPSDDDNANNE